MLNVSVNGAPGDEELLGDLPVGEPVRHQLRAQPVANGDNASA